MTQCRYIKDWECLLERVSHEDCQVCMQARLTKKKIDLLDRTPPNVTPPTIEDDEDEEDE